MLDEVLAAAAVDPHLGDGGVGSGDLVEQVGAGRGVPDTGRSDQHRRQQAERVGDDAAFPANDLLARDLLARVCALTPGGDAGEGLAALCVDHAGRRVRTPVLLLTDGPALAADC